MNSNSNYNNKKKPVAGRATDSPDRAHLETLKNHLMANVQFVSQTDSDLKSPFWTRCWRDAARRCKTSQKEQEALTEKRPEAVGTKSRFHFKK